MTTKKYSKGYGDRFPGPFTSARCIWDACIAFEAKNGEPPTSKYIKNLDLKYNDKKGNLTKVNPNNVGIELNSYKAFCRQSPDAKELDPLKNSPDKTATNNAPGVLETNESHIFPDQIGDGDNYWEGVKCTVTVNVYERDPRARQKCIEHYGPTCSVCDLNFEKRYGEIGTGFIHVHHLTPLANIGIKYEVDSIRDLRPVCPNCHAMLHQKTPPYSIEELRRIIW
ncbi:MAG: HNH endonuclease [Pseudomonadota bacterium]|jgi:hypothetical protein